MEEPKHKFDVGLENKVLGIVYESEYLTQKSNDSVDHAEFDSNVRVLENQRDARDYEWMSDYATGDMSSIILTDMSNCANMFFQTRDFVDVKLEGDGPNDKQKCVAVKKLINKTLNNRELFHFHKYLRARTINSLGPGGVVAVCWWDQKTEQELIGYKENRVPLDVDVLGNPMTSAFQEQAYRVEQEPQYRTKVIKDHFNYDVCDPRNVTMDNTYTYTIQQKKWVVIRSERSLGDLLLEAEDNSYFNLDLLKEPSKTQQETETSKETYNLQESHHKPSETPSKDFDIYTRYGRFWVIRSKDEVKPGLDENGYPKDKAELILCRISWAMKGGVKVLIRFQVEPCRDSNGIPYMPLARGWCYVHPTKDKGLSDGQFIRPLANAVNDIFNMAVDRTKLATLPTMKGRKYSLEDNSTIYFEPEHVMELESPDDIEEFKLDDNPEGAMNMIAYLTGKQQQISSIYPTTMGQMPSRVETATAVSGAAQMSNLRANYKSLTFEYTYFAEFYWIMNQMTYQFMLADTAKLVMGEEAQFFDPNSDYVYVPVSSNIEQEFNKYKKIQNNDQMIGRLTGLAKVFPQVIEAIALILKDTLELGGKEYGEVKGIIERLSQAKPQLEGGNGATQPADMQGMATSNQGGMPMSTGEMGAREMMSPGNIQ